MGTELVQRLLAAGCDVAVYNRTQAKAEPLAALGAKVVSSPADLGSRDIVFATVGTPQDLIDAVLGEAGLTSGESAPAILVDCSTVSADVSRQVREQLAARGTDLLAAPVMGNPKVASVGRLTLAVSGPQAAYDRARPYLDLLGAGSTYVGEGELARIVKLCHNLFLGVVTQSLAEVTILAQKSGVSRDAFLTCLNKSVMGSPFTRYKSPAFVNRTSIPPSPPPSAQGLRSRAGRGPGTEVPLPVASLVHQIVQTLIGHGYGDQDFAALIELEAQAAGLQLESENTDISDGLTPADATTPMQ